MALLSANDAFKAPREWLWSTPGQTLPGNDYFGTSSQDHVVGPIVEGSSTSSEQNPAT